MAVLWVNDLEVAPPSELRVELFDVGSGPVRSASGSLVSDRVAVKRRLHLKWALLSTAQMGALLGAVNDVFFDVRYPDPMTGQRTAVCRCDEKMAGLLRMVGGEPVWVDVEMIWEER